ncbi:hypothetical protein HGRIS_004081 [Hohenbuehelia grisea]|uniref:Restriction of telomere capping protein 4 n=1 Tax=Hohenbuehelia grisea TaxID=104357 RepID=A0ABR3JHE2_9AGAR
MEQAFNDLRSRNTGLYDDERSRLSKRPVPRGQGFEDLGSDFSRGDAKPPRKQPQQARAPVKSAKSSTSKKPAPRLQSSQGRYIEVDSDSGDDLDLLSSPRRRSPSPEDDEDFMKDRTDVLKTLKFKKIKALGTEAQTSATTTAKENVKALPSHSSSFPPAKKPPAVTYANRSKPAAPPSSLPLRDTGSNKGSTSNHSSTESAIGKSTRKGPKSRRDSPEYFSDSPPKPIPRRKAPKMAPHPSLTDIFDSPSKAHAIPKSRIRKSGSTDRRPPSPSPPPTTSKPEARTKPRARPVPQAFPMNALSPVSHERDSRRKLEATASFPDMSPLSSPAQKTHAASRFPIPSPVSSQVIPSSSFQGLPPISPLSTPKRNPSNGKGKAKSNGADDDDGPARVTTRPFPMGSPRLSYMGRPSPSPSKLGKRGSPQSDPEGRKKRREDSYSPMRDRSQYDEDDTILLYTQADPSTLCPYCDAPLPASPTPVLMRLLSPSSALYAKSTPDPRPGNPLGRKAPLSAFISVCHRHRFETEMLPLAERRGWPKVIHWESLGPRVERMKGDLQALIQDKDDSCAGTDGPRSRCVFWKEVMAEFKAKGSRAVTGVKGQFESFEKTQPGYYGERGAVIIHHVLFDLFPPSSIDPANIAPLPANEFILRILVPEVATRLILQDQNKDVDWDMEEGVKILRESAPYGVAMFPQDGDEWNDGSEGGEGSRKGKGKKGRHVDGGQAMTFNEGVDGDELDVGDMIVLERARKRRKELEEERAADEQWEREMEMQKQEEARPRREAARKSQHKTKKASETTEDDSDVEVSSVKRRSRSRAPSKAKSTRKIDEPAPPMPTAQTKPRPRPVAATRTIPSLDAADSDMVLDSSGAEDSDVVICSDSRPSRSRTRRTGKGTDSTGEPRSDATTTQTAKPQPRPVPVTKTMTRDVISRSNSYDVDMVLGASVGSNSDPPIPRRSRLSPRHNTETAGAAKSSTASSSLPSRIRNGPRKAKQRAIDTDVDIDLCSSSDSIHSEGPSKSKAKRLPKANGSSTNASRNADWKTPKVHPRTRALPSDEEDDEDTPKPSKFSRLNSSAAASIATGSKEPPLMAARRKILEREQSNAQMNLDAPSKALAAKDKGKGKARAAADLWLRTMAEDASEDDRDHRSDASANDFYTTRSKAEKLENAWLLSDKSSGDDEV